MYWNSVPFQQLPHTAGGNSELQVKSRYANMVGKLSSSPYTYIPVGDTNMNFPPNEIGHKEISAPQTSFRLLWVTSRFPIAYMEDTDSSANTVQLHSMM